MSTVLYRTGPRQALTLAVVAVLLTSHPALLTYLPTAVALTLTVAAGRWAYGTAAGVWVLARVHWARYIAYGALAAWALVALSAGETQLVYGTAGNMAVAR
ncbi:hypothetical protein AB1484_29340 [Parafrankia sp. FMc6]|uniref:hypothetical protein n=1 Tax=Parafrankia soli TaxID=2599596 RepID=UPI0034D63869